VSGAGSPQVEVDARGLNAVIVAASWHQVVMDGLIAGAQRECERLGVTPRLVRVPGCFELPVVAQAEARAAGTDAVICLGVIIRGGTPHFEFVATATTDGLTRVALDTGVPVGFGILTTDNEQQALDRAGLPGSPEDKGAEAAAAALATAVVLRAGRGAQ
jgi:6,7-dimethyl-8-ribityllumazine synthase